MRHITSKRLAASSAPRTPNSGLLGPGGNGTRRARTKEMKATLCAIAVLLCAGTAANGELALISLRNIHDHPQGELGPPSYALRLDDVFGDFPATFSADAQTFSFQPLISLAQEIGTGDLFITIHGTFHGGEDIGGSWDSPFDIHVYFRFQANVVLDHNSALIWRVDGFSPLNTGTITRLDTDETINLYAMEDAAGDYGPVGHTFHFAQDGWGLDPPDDPDNPNSYEWVGRGGLTTNSDGSPTGSNLSWTFITDIPTPGTLTLLGLGGIAAGRRR